MSFLTVDWSELSMQVMLTFAHFLWQACAVAIAVLIVDMLPLIFSGRSQALRSNGPERSHRSANLRYSVACLALFTLPACVVTTFGWVHQSRGPILLTFNAPIESPAVPAVVSMEPTPPLKQVDVEMLPPVETNPKPEMPAAGPLEVRRLGTPAPSSAERIQSVAPYLLVTYAIGVGLMLARFGLSIVGGSRLRRTLQPITDSTLLRVIAEHSTRLGLKRVPIVARCQRVTVPVVVGILKPVILLPPSLLCGLDPNQLAAILSHEMAHIRRYDMFVNLLQRIVEALLFFHPVTWWISRRVSIERENCCDDLAAACSGRLPYAGALLQMAELCMARDRKRLASLASLSADGANSTDFGYRIRRLIGEEQVTWPACTRRGIAVGVAIALLLLVSLVAWGQNQTAEKKAEADIQWSTWGDNDGLLCGVRLVLPQGGLKPGQPLVVEYRLANVSKETKTLECFLNNGMQLVFLGRGNRISGSGFDWHTEPVTLTIEPGDVFVDSEHLVSIDTTGLEPGDYEAALGSAFHYPDEAKPKTAHEIPHRGSIPFTIVGESKVQARELPKNDIHWGNPIAGLQLGAKFAGDQKAFTVGATVEADLFVANVTDQPIECSVVMPARRDGWLFNVEDRNGKVVTLERAISIPSYSPPQYILLKLAPGEITPITGEGMFRVSMTPHSDVEPIQYTSPNVRFQVVGSKDEARPPWQVEGFPMLEVFAMCTVQHELSATQPWQDDGANWGHRKLVSEGAEFSTIFGVTLLRPEIPGVRLHLDSGNVPFSVTNAVVHSSPALLKESFRLPEHSSVGEVGFVSDSQSIASLAWETAADHQGLRVTVRNWSLATQERTGEVDLEWQPDWTHYVANLLLSQDGTRVVGLLDGQIAVWDAGSGKIIHRHDIPEDITNDQTYSVTLSHLTGTPDLSRIAFGRSVSLGGTLPNADAIVWDTHTGRVIQKIKMEHRVQVQSLALSADGRRLATVGSQYGASIWDVESGQLVLDFRNDNVNRKHPNPTVKTSSTQLVSSVGFSPSAKSFAVRDMLGIKLVDTQTGKVLRNIDAPYRYYDANSQFIFSADGQLFTLLGTVPEDGEPRTISIWSAESGERLRTLAIQATAAAFSADGKWFAAGKSDANEALAVWQIREDKPAKPAVVPPDQANEKDSQIREFQLVDGKNGTPLQGIECKANIFKQGTPPRLQPCRSNHQGIVEVQVFEGEGAWIAEVPRGWFTSAPSVTVIELDENGKPKHEQTAVNNQEPAVVKLWRGEEVTGRLLWPDKTAAVGVKLTAGVYINNPSWKEKLGMDLTWYSFDHGDWPNWNRTVVTDDAGRFRFTVPPEQARWWLRIGTTALGFGPQIGFSEDDSVTQRLAKCMPLEIQYGGNGRGNIPVTALNSTASDEVLRPGDLQLQTGVVVRGRVVDAEGEGLSNVHLTTTGPHGPHSGRKAISGEDGKFEFPAMAAGNLTVHPDARFRDGKEKLTGTANTRDVQAVFVSQSFTIPETDKPHEIAIRAVPHTEIRFEWVDRREDKTQPISFYDTFRVRGYMPDDNGKPSTYWTSETERVERDGNSLLVVKIPTQLLKPELMLVADRKVTASYSDSTGVTSGPGIVPLGDITANTTRTIFGDEPRKPGDPENSQEPASNDQSNWIPARPLKVTVLKEGTAKILADHSVRLEGDVPWQEASMQFVFDKPISVQEIRLEILPVESPTGPQFGRGGYELMLFDVKPSITDQAGKSSSLDFASCTYLQNPSDERTAGCIDHLSDTGWKVPSLPAAATAHELVLRFEKPITLRAGQRLTFTVDSGGADKLAVLNRIRFAFHQAAVSKPLNDQEGNALTVDEERTLRTLANETTATWLSEIITSIFNNVPEPAKTLPDRLKLQGNTRNELKSDSSKFELVVRNRVNELGGTMTMRKGNDDSEEVRLKLMSKNALVSDDDLELFAKMTNLTRLEFQADNVTSHGIAQISRMTNLKKLDIWDSRLSDDDVGKLHSLKRLEWLGLYRCLNVTDRSSQHLRQLPELHSLNLYGTPIAASFLQAMQGQRIRFLDLRRTGVTREDLVHIEGFPQLRQINLPDDVTDEDLSHLRGLGELKILTLQHLSITDAGLSHLKALPKVETLYLNQTHITDDGLANLAGMANLDTLDLSGTPISTAGLTHLATLPKLHTLDLQATEVDDESLKRLSQFPRLQFLDVRDTHTTEAAVAALRESRPKIKIQWNP